MDMKETIENLTAGILLVEARAIAAEQLAFAMLRVLRGNELLNAETAQMIFEQAITSTARDSTGSAKTAVIHLKGLRTEMESADLL